MHSPHPATNLQVYSAPEIATHYAALDYLTACERFLFDVHIKPGMAILDARQEGKGLPLQLENGTHMAVLAGPSEFTVSLDAGLPLSIEAGRASFSLPVPSVGRWVKYT